MSTADRHTQVQDLLPAYALGAADADEARRVDEHLEECAECRADLLAWRRSAEELAGSAEPVAPSPGVRERLLAEVVGGAAADRRDRPGRPGGPEAPRGATTAARGTRFHLAAVVALSAVALAALAWGLIGQSRLRGEVETLEHQVAQLENRLEVADVELARSRSELRSAQAVLALLAGTSPRQDVLLAGLETAPGGYGRLIIDPENRQAVLLAGDLPPLPEGRVYQLWSLSDGTPAPAGIFETVADGTAIHRVENVPAEAPDGWAVTIEPEGGVPQPTGPMVLVG